MKGTTARRSGSAGDKQGDVCEWDSGVKSSQDLPTDLLMTDGCISHWKSHLWIPNVVSSLLGNATCPRPEVKMQSLRKKRSKLPRGARVQCVLCRLMLMTRKTQLLWTTSVSYFSLLQEETPVSLGIRIVVKYIWFKTQRTGGPVLKERRDYLQNVS